MIAVRFALLFCLGVFAGKSMGADLPLFTPGNSHTLSSYRANLVQTVNDAGGYGASGELQSLWANIGQTFQVPQNWSSYDAIVVQVQNHENRWVQLELRADFSPNLSDSSQVVRGKFIIGPNDTQNVVLDLHPKSTAIHRPVPGGITGFRVFWINNVRRETAYRWFVSLDESNRAKVTFRNARVVQNTAPATAVVDEYGQTNAYTWDGKIESNTDLQNARQAELSDLSLNPPPSSVFGPVVAGAPTGKWSVVRLPSGKWTITNHQGRQFWSFGLTTVRTRYGTPVQGRDTLFSSLPPDNGTNPHWFTSTVDGKRSFNFYTSNLEAKYGANWNDEFPSLAMNRVRSWQFNTLSAWADPRMLATSPIPFVISTNTENMPFRLTAPYRDARLLPDPYQPNFQSILTQRLTEQIAPFNGLPNFMGFYVDGELKWANHQDPSTKYQVGFATLNAPPTQPAKAILINRLRLKYRNISRLNQYWGTSFTSWEQLWPQGAVSQRPIRGGFDSDMRQFTLEYIRAYYVGIRNAINSMQPTGLFLGCRDHMFAPEQIVEIAAPFVDLYSVAGYGYTERMDWNFSRYNRPILLYEMAFGSTVNGGWYPGSFVAGSADDRRERMINYYRRALQSPKVVGAHWFQYGEPPVTGREGDLENLSSGFVSITDTPHQELVDAARYIGRNIFTIRGTN